MGLGEVGLHHGPGDRGVHLLRLVGGPVVLVTVGGQACHLHRGHGGVHCESSSLIIERRLSFWEFFNIDERNLKQVQNINLLFTGLVCLALAC